MKLDAAILDATVTTIASRTTYGGAGASAVGWAANIDWLTVVGVAVAVIGLAVNVYFQIRRDRRESVLNQARIAALREKQ
ncbi:holin [Candidimonas nitroreducens]|uniref:Holin n=1 Tax=Candidimonas nitroreducens TaxID=683354 RepID=A0A225MKX9_9BURK|nr:holin [Candidimonas nitroreducens]OWT62027.1 holin [Candidimonas nitroreducens]